MTAIPTTPKVLVVAPHFSDGFMRDDLRLMHAFVEPITQELGSAPLPGGERFGRTGRAAQHVLLFLYRLLRHDVRIVVFWFATANLVPLLARLAKLLGRKVVVVTGGQDAVYLPEIDWGDLKHPRHRSRYATLVSLADAVLPFSDSARRDIERLAQPRHLVTAYPSVDSAFFAPRAVERHPRVVTCCYEYGAGNIVQKGLDQFVAVARRLPELEFVVVGNPIDDAARRLQAGAPPNVRFRPRIPAKSGYRDFLAESAVYAQLSAHEGFGVSLAEAMACGCVPVASDRYSLPEVVGDAGHVVAYADEPAAATAIAAAARANGVARDRARARVVSLFDRPQRAALLRREFTRLDPSLAQQPLRIELGCGSTGVAGAIGVDARRTVQTSAVCDVRHSCFRSGIADEVYSFCVLEHLDDPYQLMDEVVRILKPDGRAFLRVPNIGTFSSHLDTTHRFLADLKIWRGIMEGYFESVTVVPEGTKYRDSRLLAAINWALVHLLGFKELTQGWTFVCARRRATPRRGYTGWWQEAPVDG